MRTFANHQRRAIFIVDSVEQSPSTFVTRGNQITRIMGKSDGIHSIRMATESTVVSPVTKIRANIIDFGIGDRKVICMYMYIHIKETQV